MTSRDIIENVHGLISGAKGSSVIPPPYLIMVPVGTNLLELVGEPGEKKTLCDTLLAIEDVQDVQVSEDSKGLSIETIT